MASAYTAAIAAGLVWSCAGAAWAQGEAEINVAARVWGTRASASSEYGEAYRAENVTDGRWHARETDKWNSAEKQQAPFWLTLDLGCERQIHAVAIRHETGAAVTADFQIQRGDTAEGPWSDLVAPLAGNRQAVTRHTFAPVNARYVRVWITKGEQNGNAYARLFEVEVFARQEAVWDALAADEVRRAWLLERWANSGQLDAARFGQAVAWLDHSNLFVRALADWTVSQVVGQTNNGDRVLWDAAQSAPEVKRWAGRSHDDRIAYDWIRHLSASSLLFSGEAIRDEVGQLLKRKQPMLAAVARDPVRLACVRQAAEAVEALYAQMEPSDVPGCRRLWLEARRAWRPAVLAQPAIDFSALLLYTRYGFHYKPNVCGVHTSWSYKPGGDLLSVALDGGAATPLLQGRLGPGHLQGADLWFGGDRAVFAFAPQPLWPPPYPTRWPEAGPDNACYAHELRETMEPPHLYEIALAERAVTQLTDHNYWSDIEPVYTPDGAVVFSSDRSGHSPSCDSINNDLTDLNLYRLTPDRKHVRRLLNHKDIDMHPRVLSNGLIAYLRWEYQERNFMEVHAVWTVKPDGTMADALFKQHLAQPYGVRLAGSLGDGTRLLAVATGHHSLPQGPLVVLNPAKGVNSPEGVEVLTQGMRVHEGRVPGRPVAEGGRQDPPGFYTDPLALSPTCFLASFAFASPRAVRYKNEAADVDSNGYGVYLLDVYGNKELLFRDPWMGAYGARPLKARPGPPVLADTTDRTQNYAVCLVPDVYQGLVGVERGTIRHIRISEALPWPVVPREGVKRWVTGWTNQDKRATRWCPVRVIGIVPVEADGSAHFKVPIADSASVYFQALDENFMEVQRMRSSVSFAPGERRSCNGCHETRLNTEVERRGSALARAPSEPVPPAWGATRPIDFESDIQPIFTKHCAGCHGGEKPKGGFDFSAGRAFLSIRTNNLVVCSSVHMDGAITQPKQFGSHASRLTLALRQGHKQVNLSPREWLSLVTWVDANIPYTGQMFNKRLPDGRTNVWTAYEWPDPWGLPHETPALGERSPKGLL